MVVSDFNGDGKPDLATAGGDNDVSVLVNKGDGTFAAHQAYTVGNPKSVAVGDFDADGKPDLAITNGDDTVSVLLNGGFAGTPTVVGAPLCAGQSLTLTFAVKCPLTGFTAQLSDANGSFVSYVGLGTISPGSNSVVIPATTPTGTGYRIRVVKNGSGLVSEPSAAFAVNGPPVIQSLTPSQSICPGQPFTLSVAATGGNLTYQWYQVLSATQSTALAGATSPSLTITPSAAVIPTLLAQTVGRYSVVVSGLCGLGVTSPAVTLTLKPATTLEVTSRANTVCEGENLTLSVRGQGPGSLKYSWRKDDPNGPVIATTSSFTIQNAQVADAGTYYASVLGDCVGPTVSIPVTVRYVRITQQPQSQQLCSGSTTLTVGVQAVGLTPTYLPLAAQRAEHRRGHVGYAHRADQSTRHVFGGDTHGLRYGSQYGCRRELRTVAAGRCDSGTGGSPQPGR